MNDPISAGLDALIRNMGDVLSTGWTCPAPDPEPLPGSVVAHYKTVGDKRYGPYWYRVWRDETGRRHKARVPDEELEATRRACEARRRLRRTKPSRLVREYEASMDALFDGIEALRIVESGGRPEDAERPGARRLIETLAKRRRPVR